MEGFDDHTELAEMESEEEEVKGDVNSEEFFDDKNHYDQPLYIALTPEESTGTSFFSFILLAIVIVTTIALCIRSPAIFYSFITCCKTGRVVKIMPFLSSRPSRQGYSILPMGDKTS